MSKRGGCKVAKHNEELKYEGQEVRKITEDKSELQTSYHFIRDSTDNEEVELAAIQMRYKALFDNMPNGCAYYKVLLDESENPVDLKYMKVNPAYEDKMGRPRIELIGKRVTEVLPQLTEASLHWIKTYIKVALFGEPVAFMQYLDYQDKWYSISAYSPQRGYVISISEDITERKGRETKAEQYVVKLVKRNIELEKMQTPKKANQKQVELIERVSSLGSMVKGVAHEINQPLQALKIMADGMIYWYNKGKETSIQKVIENCRRISVQAGNITSIVELMQDSANRAWSDTPEEVNVINMIKQALTMLQDRLSGCNIQLRVNPCIISPSVWGDIRLLEEIVIVILVNAIESLDCVNQPLKEIVITTSCVEKRVVIEISNNGPAIPDDIIGKIFEPFFSSAKPDTNLGMGLAIVQSIVDSHNGTIQAFSMNKQVTFRIEFPIYVQ